MGFFSSAERLRLSSTFLRSCRVRHSPARCRCRRRRCPSNDAMYRAMASQPFSSLPFSVRITSSKSSMGCCLRISARWTKCRRTYPLRRSASARCKGLPQCGTACRPAAYALPVLDQINIRHLVQQQPVGVIGKIQAAAIQPRGGHAMSTVSVIRWRVSSLPVRVDLDEGIARHRPRRCPATRS